MVENQSGQENKSDDLDLINLLERVFSFFWNYMWLIASFSIAGMFAGFALYKMSPRLYESTMLLHSSTLSNSEQINIIENWNALLKGREYAALGGRLHCDSAMLTKVAKISAVEMQKLFMPNNPNAFVVTALVKDNNVLDTLSAGIVTDLKTMII
ncbi:MAG: hypothetical protein ABJB86_24330 [Bacteroidota bacterium]